ncbi:MAG: polysulfide reductase NrfD [Anaerolineales bacterium]|nr:polysulfide reductase NrfD [Anaerolineales bacterium]
MEHKEDIWGWMLAVDFFFAGMGGAMLVIGGVAGLFLDQGSASWLGNILAPLFIALGAGLLILELGRPFRAWRVFMNPKAILTVGAWCMLLAIGLGLISASFAFEIFPWSGASALRQAAAALGAVFGLVVATYPGILLGRHKARPFWSGPGMMVLFLVSSLATGCAALLLSGLIVPPETSGLQAILPGLTIGLLAFQLLLWPAYLWVKHSGTTDREARAAELWLKGDFSLGFLAGVLLAGTLLPLACLMLGGTIFQAIGALLVLVGGLFIRLLVIYSGVYRTWLPGEEKYRSRLPTGDEAFLKALKSK